ncbi:MAG: hypothetical protein HY795_03585 [Desulfovibrio sp.]|nr:hypothetical protein [Desulfovibrio sp.]MBI4957957.1 hypothetical protein [Desulfovibrio sp.]
MKCIVGFDFDNTLVDYGSLFLESAVEERLLTTGTGASKSAIRAAIQGKVGGEISWRSLQARVYGRDIARASIHQGVRELLFRLGSLGLPVYVVSHKTPTASYRGQSFNLRQAALDFMTENGLLGNGSPLSPERVFFESTREEKAVRIASLGCTVFVDDLPEVFLNPSFPLGVKQVLFMPEGEAPEAFKGILCRDWARIADTILRGAVDG